MIPNLDTLMYWIGQSAVVLMAAAGVLEAGRKRFDLFGMAIVALAAALGGGTVRDLLLGRPVFWVADQTYLMCALGAALVTFFLARVFVLPARLFLIPDAAGLALFTVTGTKAALVWGAPWLVASIMGVTTGVVGGILRDVLCNEEPLVFRGTLYATASWTGALVLIGLLDLDVDARIAAVSAGSAIFLLRVAAIRWGIGLPRFRAKGA
ncbi:trimeric intracellular cation channel family protein [uncultured Thiodictyon sp.]|uniref:trimeric intracellular cation channel family protein n=1 Tax=uncultured Thiodictyon sp. TaxID=1846217 RepID=UPI0025F54D15|nr:trimeric intracellular cation channel family protein [uncultured Thiodictyon sp.]